MHHLTPERRLAWVCDVSAFHANQGWSIGASAGGYRTDLGWTYVVRFGLWKWEVMFGRIARF